MNSGGSKITQNSQAASTPDSLPLSSEVGICHRSTSDDDDDLSRDFKISPVRRSCREDRSGPRSWEADQNSKAAELVLFYLSYSGCTKQVWQGEIGILGLGFSWTEPDSKDGETEREERVRQAIKYSWPPLCCSANPDFTHSLREGGNIEEELGEIFHSVATFQKVHLPVPRMLFLSMSRKARKGHSSGSDAAQQRSKKGQTKCNSGGGGGGIHFSSSERTMCTHARTLSHPRSAKKVHTDCRRRERIPESAFLFAQLGRPLGTEMSERGGGEGEQRVNRVVK